jgi:hypothetical protein
MLDIAHLTMCKGTCILLTITFTAGRQTIDYPIGVHQRKRIIIMNGGYGYESPYRIYTSYGAYCGNLDIAAAGFRVSNFNAESSRERHALRTFCQWPRQMVL